MSFGHKYRLEIAGNTGTEGIMGRFDNPSRIVARVASTFPLRAISDVQIEPEE